MNSTEQIIYWADIIPIELEEKVRAGSTRNMVDAANTLEWNLLEGFQKNTNRPIMVINVLPVGSFPQYYNEAFVRRSHFSVPGQVDAIELGFCNVKLLRKKSIAHSLYKETCRKLKSWSSRTTIIAYAASPIYLKTVKKLKKRFPNIKICMIIADLPGMTNLSSNKPFIVRAYEKFEVSDFRKNIEQIDCFAFLTKQMKDYLKTDKPYCVVEGIACEDVESHCLQGTDKKVIVYTGTLHKMFGVMNLVEAFGRIETPDYRLIICGIGDSEKEIREAAGKDSRISFLGQLTRKEVLELQKGATVLVNPRQNNEEFTKYSFPSKTMEYLSSGIPVVAYKLDGIPDEYDQYIQYVEDDSIEGLKRKLVEVCGLSEEDRVRIGQKGRDFVLREKNSQVQTKKIIDLIDSI